MPPRTRARWRPWPPIRSSSNRCWIWTRRRSSGRRCSRRAAYCRSSPRQGPPGRRRGRRALRRRRGRPSGSCWPRPRRRPWPRRPISSVFTCPRRPCCGSCPCRCTWPLWCSSSRAGRAPPGAPKRPVCSRASSCWCRPPARRRARRRGTPGCRPSPWPWTRWAFWRSAWSGTARSLAPCPPMRARSRPSTPAPLWAGCWGPPSSSSRSPSWAPPRAGPAWIGWPPAASRCWRSSGAIARFGARAGAARRRGSRRRPCPRPRRSPRPRCCRPWRSASSRDAATAPWRSSTTTACASCATTALCTEPNVSPSAARRGRWPISRRAVPAETCSRPTGRRCAGRRWWDWAPARWPPTGARARNSSSSSWTGSWPAPPATRSTSCAKPRRARASRSRTAAWGLPPRRTRPSI